jgi:hypothetical protein
MSWPESQYMFEGFFWSQINIDNKWKVISGLQTFLTPAKSFSGISAQHEKPAPDKPGPIRNRSSNDDNLTGSSGGPQIARHCLNAIDRLGEEFVPGETMPKAGPYDCTMDNDRTEGLNPHVAYFRSIHWGQTPLGEIKQWPPILRQAVNVVMKDSNPAVLFWGPEVIMIYNEAYIQILGVLHPCLGKSARIAARDYWGHCEPLVQHIDATGSTVVERDLPMFLERHSFLEETFFSFQFIPILDGNGYVAGYYEPISETTKYVH